MSSKRPPATAALVWLCFAAAPAASMKVLADPISVEGYEISLFSSGIGASAGMRFDADGALYVTDYGGGRILRVDSSGAASVVASGVPYLTDIAFTASGRAFVASSTGPASTIYETSISGNSCA